MICTKCGKETPDDSAFCEHCGRAVTSAENLVAASSADNAEDAATFSDLNDAKPAEAANDLEPEATSADAEPSDIADAYSPIIDSDSESVAIGLESVTQNSSHSQAAENDSYHSDSSANGDSKFAPIDLYSRLKNLDVSTMQRPNDEDEFVYPASVPLQPNLGRTRTIIIAVVGTLFGAALILLFCIAVMRLLGL